MKFVLLIFSALIFVASKGQDYELPQVNQYNISWHYWADTVTGSQKEYWDNGNLKVEYARIKEDKKLKKEYFENGRLKLTVEIKQVFAIDTIRMIDPITLEELVEVHRGYKDIEEGEYKEYNNWPYEIENHVMTLGYYKDGKKYGKWQTTKGPLGDIVIATYNIDGMLDGEYLEYHNLREGKMERIRWKGQYGVVTVTRLMYDYQTKDYLPKSYNVSRKVGKWLLFDIDGKVLETVSYNWNN